MMHRCTALVPEPSKDQSPHGRPPAASRRPRPAPNSPTSTPSTPIARAATSSRVSDFQLLLLFAAMQSALAQLLFAGPGGGDGQAALSADALQTSSDRCATAPSDALQPVHPRPACQPPRAALANLRRLHWAARAPLRGAGRAAEPPHRYGWKVLPNRRPSAASGPPPPLSAKTSLLCRCLLSQIIIGGAAGGGARARCGRPWRSGPARAPCTRLARLRISLAAC